MRVMTAFLLVGLMFLPMAQAGDEGVAGNWKVTIYQEDGSQVAYWFLHLENKGGKWAGSVESLNKVAPTTLSDVQIAGELVQFNLKLPKGQVFNFQGKLPKAGGKKILGSLARGPLMIPTVLEATGAKNSFELDRDLVLRTPNDPRVFGAVMNLIDKAKENKIPAKDLQEWTETALRTAENFGPRWQIDQGQQIVDALLSTDNYGPVAVETARNAMKVLDAKVPLDTRLRMLTSYETALKQTSQLDKVKEVQAHVEKLEIQAYKDNEASASDFKVNKYAGRKMKSNRAVLVELFTGAQCPPCVGADMAFDAMAKAYETKDVVLLQYHLHIPGPDALTNAETEVRADYYGDEKVLGTPTVLFNGKVAPVSGSTREDAEEVFKEYSKLADALLESPAGPSLQAGAVRKGDKIHIKAAVQNLDKPGAKMKLRIALAEDWARYKGRNGINYYHQVLRTFAGGVAGFPLTQKDSEHAVVVDLEELRRNLTTYLDKTGKEEPFLDSQRPMRLRNLNVVAFIQNDATQEVLQAVQAPVADE